MTRTPQEVFQHHAQALGAGDLDEIVADYTDDAVFITPAGVQRGLRTPVGNLLQSQRVTVERQRLAEVLHRERNTQLIHIGHVYF